MVQPKNRVFVGRKFGKGKRVISVNDIAETLGVSIEGISDMT